MTEVLVYRVRREFVYAARLVYFNACALAVSAPLLYFTFYNEALQRPRQQLKLKTKLELLPETELVKKAKEEVDREYTIDRKRWVVAGMIGVTALGMVGVLRYFLFRLPEKIHVVKNSSLIIKPLLPLAKPFEIPPNNIIAANTATVTPAASTTTKTTTTVKTNNTIKEQLEGLTIRYNTYYGKKNGQMIFYKFLDSEVLNANLIKIVVANAVKKQKIQ